MARYPARNARQQLQLKYGLSREQAEVALISQQGDFCAACGEFDRLLVDHDHATGKARGMVCARCNQIAGAIEDPNHSSVLTYLQRRSA